MLSAVAARKAAQAAKLAAASQPPSSTSEVIVVSEGNSESDSERLEPLLPNPKRKREDLNPEKSLRKKRRKKFTKAETTQTRYYDSVEAPSGAIEQDKGSSSFESSDDEDVQEVCLPDPELREIVEPVQPRKNKGQRAWSPSRLPGDTSDGEVDLSSPHYPSGPGSRAETSRNARYQTAQSLSFVPRPEKNVFYIVNNDIQPLPDRKGVVVTLAKGETTALLGVYSLTVLRGCVSLMGSELHPSTSRSHTIFAPRCSPIPVIMAMSSSDTSSCPLPERINRSVDPGDTVLFLEDVHTGVEGLGRICKTFENIFETASFGDDTLRLSCAKLLTTIPRSLQTFQLPVSWTSALTSLPSALSEHGETNLEPLTLLVKGQKRTGKSTFARTLVNRLVCQYRHVAYLECDIGQTEFTPPGIVSLHVIDRPIFGPPFTHPLLPYASHFIGATSPKDSPEHYLASVSALLQTYKLELQYPVPEDEFFDSDQEAHINMDVIPLVVNTMGWLKGLGADLARQIEELSTPTHIFSTRSDSSPMDTDPASEATALPPMRNYDTRIAKPRVFDLDAIPTGVQVIRYTAADWRNLSLMSYFHSIPSPVQYELLPLRIRLPEPVPLEPRAPLCTWNCQIPLLARAPYSVSAAEAIDNILLVGAGMEDVVPSEIARVLNGAVVALVSSDMDSPSTPASSLPSTGLPYHQAASPPDPSRSNCIGLALIRGISPSLLAEEERSSTGDVFLYILTPVPPILVAATSARCIVKGEIELPIWGMLDYREFGRSDFRAHEINGIPYLQWNKSDAIGADRRRVRRNIMRKGQM